MITWRRCRQQTGSVLLFALTLISVLLLSAANILTGQGAQAELTGGMRQRMVSIYIAEAGLTAANLKLQNTVAPAGGTVSASQPKNLKNLPALTATDPICRDGTDCTQWHSLATGVQSYGSGGYRIAGTCYPNACDSGLPVTGYLLRSLVILGSDLNGTNMLEAAVSSNL